MESWTEDPFQSILEGQEAIKTQFSTPPGGFMEWRKSGDYLVQQLFGFEIVLCPDGAWFLNDTSGG